MYKTPLVENVFALGLNDEPCKKAIDRVAALSFSVAQGMVDYKLFSSS